MLTSVEQIRLIMTHRCVSRGELDVATQSVFTKASKYDPLGERTIGVLTRCDICTTREFSDKVLK
jgi:hypothetical protein